MCKRTAATRTEWRVHQIHAKLASQSGQWPLFSVQRHPCPIWLTCFSALASCVVLLQQHVIECVDEAIVLQVQFVCDWCLLAFVDKSQVARTLCNVTAR
jgi:hypothetical protein